MRIACRETANMCGLVFSVESLRDAVRSTYGCTSIDTERVEKHFGVELKPISHKSEIWLRTSVENCGEGETPAKGRRER